MTWHPNWKVMVDGRPRPTVMLSPGFLGVEVEAGVHQVECRYQPAAARTWIAFGGSALVLVMALGRRAHS